MAGARLVSRPRVCAAKRFVGLGLTVGGPDAAGEPCCVRCKNTQPCCLQAMTESAGNMLVVGLPAASQLRNGK
jgi:hypothetical protein